MSLERANQLRDLGRWLDAESLYAELLRQEPGNLDAQFDHALNLMASEDLVLFEVAVADDRAEGKDDLGTV